MNRWSCGIQTLKEREREEHEDNECLEGVVACRFGCPVRNLLRKVRRVGVTICTTKQDTNTNSTLRGMMQNMAVHEVGCNERPMPCPMGAECIVPFSQLKAHPVRDCPERIVWCKWGCGVEGLKAKFRSDHEDTHAICPKRQVVNVVLPATPW